MLHTVLSPFDDNTVFIRAAHDLPLCAGYHLSVCLNRRQPCCLSEELTAGYHHAPTVTTDPDNLLAGTRCPPAYSPPINVYGPRGDLSP